jgi:hypothetical protein
MIFKMLSLKILQGQIKGEREPQNPSLFGTKASKFRSNTAFFGTFCHAVAASAMRLVCEAGRL